MIGVRDARDSNRTMASELPDDPALLVLGKIRTRGLAQVVSEPELELAVLLMHNYVPGSRATLEARVADRRFVIKIYADDPSAEAEVYRRLAVLGLAGDSGPRVPRLLSWDRDQKILVLSWLEGPSASQLVKDGKGRRAGELAVAWLRAASGGDVRFGPRRGCGHLLYQVGVSVGALTAANPVLGATAKRTAKVLERTQPEEGTPHLVHGTLYARHTRLGGSEHSGMVLGGLSPSPCCERSEDRAENPTDSWGSLARGRGGVARGAPAGLFSSRRRCPRRCSP